MSALWSRRPAADEHPAYYATYVNRVQVGKPPAVFGRQLAETLTLLDGLSELQSLARYAPGKWSIKEVVGHVTDAERVFSYRALRFARGDRTPLPGFDEQAYAPAGRFDARPLADLARELALVRAATIALFRGFDAEMLERRGVANGQEISVRALAYVIAGHERHHVAILRERYLV